MMEKFPSLLLASKSPRRQELLRIAGIDFEVLDMEVDESYPVDMDPEAVPKYLAQKKAIAALPYIQDKQVILAADSVVIMNGIIYGKPADRNHAIEMIASLAGHKHLVITGVFFCNQNKSKGFFEHTFVWIDDMTRKEIEYYVDTYKPFDKAGAYGIQDWIGWAKVSRIEGSYSNVMGLPVQSVYKELQNWKE